MNQTATKRVTSGTGLERTGRMPKSVTVVLGQETVVMHEALSPAERALAKSPTGAAQVQKLHRRLFDDSCESLRKEIKRIYLEPARRRGSATRPLRQR